MGGLSERAGQSTGRPEYGALDQGWNRKFGASIFWTSLSELWGLSSFTHGSNLTCNRETCPALSESASEIPELHPSSKGPLEEEKVAQG